MSLQKLLLAFLLLAASCAGSHQDLQYSEYPKVIDSLGLQFQYDKTKWHLYLLHCDDTPKNIENNYLVSPVRPLSTYDLRFDSLVIRQDTVELYFDFFLDDSTAINCINFRDMKTELNNGLIFFSGIDSPLCYVFNCADATKSICLEFPQSYFDTTTNRFANPLQPDVIKYLNDHKKDLNPWLYAEAVKRGVIKDSL